jgi:putative DNA primase/helicase
MTIRTLPARLTQVDIVDELLACYGQELRYDASAKTWLTFSAATGWTPDPYEARFRELCITLARDLHATTAPVGLTRQEAKRWERSRVASAERVQTAGGLRALSDLASRRAPIIVESKDLDASAHLLGVPNGVVNLRTGELGAFVREELITRRTAVRYNPEAECPRWERFLVEVLGEDPDTQAHLQRLFGYWLTGETREQKMHLLHGSGANGKTTMIDTWRDVLGYNYAQTAAETVLIGKAGASNHSSELVRLKGVRFAQLSETDMGQSFHESRLKSLVSGDDIAGRALFENYQTISPVVKFVICTNNLPNVRGSDHGIWRRLVVVPFERTFDVDADSDLDEVLESEREGILAWAVRGAVAYYQQRLGAAPTAWQTATGDYRQEEDVITAFLGACCTASVEGFVAASVLYKTYYSWCEVEGREALKQDAFGKRLSKSRRARSERKGEHRRAHWVGIVLAQ